MPRKNNSKAKREAVITAFGSLLVTLSPEKITMGMLSEASGVPFGSMHYFFKNKQEIMIAYATKLLSGYLDRAKLWAEGIDPDIADFPAFFRSYLAFANTTFSYESSTRIGEYEHYFAIVYQTPALRSFSTELTKNYAAVIVRAIEKTRFRCQDPEKLAYLLIALTDGVSTLCQENGIDQDRQLLLSRFADVLDGCRS